MLQVLPIIGSRGLRPFLQLVMAHISSAMTSLSDAVRWVLASAAHVPAETRQPGRQAIAGRTGLAMLTHAYGQPTMETGSTVWWRNEGTHSQAPPVDRCRVDALGFLEAMTAVVPGAVAAGFMAPALEHFRDLLGRDTRGASIKSRSLATLHKARLVARRWREVFPCVHASPARLLNRLLHPGAVAG
jgi:hypothetical protein